MQAPTHILPVSFLCFPYATILFTSEVNLFLASIAIKVFPCVLHGHKGYLPGLPGYPANQCYPGPVGCLGCCLGRRLRCGLDRSLDNGLALESCLSYSVVHPTFHLPVVTHGKVECGHRYVVHSSQRYAPAMLVWIVESTLGVVSVTQLFHKSRRQLCCFLIMIRDEAITGCMIASLRVSVQEIGYPRRRMTAAVAHTQDVSIRNTAFLLDKENLTLGSQ